MSDLRDALNRLAMPINKEGYFIIAVSCFVTFILLLISDFLGVLGIIATVFIIYFFRDPKRIVPDDKDVVLASADGIVDKIEDVLVPEELKLKSKEKFQRVSIFLNVFNVHVQRIPLSGKIEKLEYVQGKFLNITNDKYSKDNERQLCLMKSDHGFNVIFVQIAGTIARRIICNLKEGEEVKAGYEFGCIKFGSRVDVYLPKEVKLTVKVGQTMIAGETVIGRILK